MELFIIIMFALISLVFMSYLGLIIGGFKLLAFGVDFVVIIFYTLYFFHPHVTAKLLYGNWQYVFDGIFVLLVLAIYIALMIILNTTLPLISNIFNFFISYMGLTVAIPFVFGLITAIFPNFASSWVIDETLIFSYNTTVNFIVKYTLLLILTIPVWQYRMNKLEDI